MEITALPGQMDRWTELILNNKLWESGPYRHKKMISTEAVNNAVRNRLDNCLYSHIQSMVRFFQTLNKTKYYCARDISKYWRQQHDE